MSTYPMNGTLPQSARYIGQFVPQDDTIQYFYIVVAYDRSRAPLTAGGTYVTAMGPTVLDGDHAISINWSPVIGASFFNVYKSTSGPPPADGSIGIWWNASASETSVLDVGYPCTTRNSFLNPGGSPVFLLQVAPPPPPPPDPCATPQSPCPPPVTPLSMEPVDYGLGL